MKLTRWKKKTIEQKVNSAMFWFRVFAIVSIIESIFTLAKL